MQTMNVLLTPLLLKLILRFVFFKQKVENAQSKYFSHALELYNQTNLVF